MPIIDPRGYNMVPDASGFSGQIGDIISQNIMQGLAQKAMAGDQDALTQLNVRNPGVGQRIGGILQDQKDTEEQQRKTYQDMAYRVARGYKTAKDKAGYLSAAAQQLRAAGLEDMAAEIDDDVATYSKNPAVVDQEYSGIYDMFDPASTQDAATRNFQFMTQGLSPEEIEKARKVELGILPRAGISAQERIAMDPEMTSDVASSQATIKAQGAGAAEAAKLTAQEEKLPSIQGAVTAAKEAAKAGAAQTGKAKSNATALSVYQAGVSNLKAALGDTTTGPLIGWAPALTANQQRAEGAVAAMAPILKEIFRTAGEGTFSDADQKMLIATIPTRGTHPEAAAAQLKVIDQIVTAKLGQQSQDQSQADSSIDPALLEFMTPEERALFK